MSPTNSNNPATKASDSASGDADLAQVSQVPFISVQIQHLSLSLLLCSVFASLLCLCFSALSLFLSRVDIICLSICLLDMHGHDGYGNLTICHQLKTWIDVMG
jgi:hypothetical protein